MWKFSTNVGLLRRYCFPFSFTLDSIVDKVIYIDCGCRHCCASIQRMVGRRSSLRLWAFLCLMSFHLADGANPGPDHLGSTDECLGPGRDSSIALRCHGWYRFFVQRSVCLSLWYVGSGGIFGHQQLPWRKLVMVHLGQHSIVSTVRTIV